MASNTKSPPARGTFTIGRNSFAKISEVEGIKPSHRLNEDFQDFDRKGLSAEERRRIIARKYGGKA